MPNTPVMIRIPPEVMAKLDADRGDVNRSEWMRTLIVDFGVVPKATENPKSEVRKSKPETPVPGSRHPSGEEKPKSKPKSKPSPQFTKGVESVEKASKCAHPPNRRLGDGCAACGVTGLKK